MDQPYHAIGCSDYDVLLALTTLRRNMHCTLLQPDEQHGALVGVGG